MPESELKDIGTRLAQARHHDPFQVLGHHPVAGLSDEGIYRAFLPDADHVSVQQVSGQPVSLTAIGAGGIWEWRGRRDDLPPHPWLHWTDREGRTHSEQSPYTFAPQVGEMDLHLFNEGRHWNIYDRLGAHPKAVDGISGVGFAVWAPGAERVSVVGDFNGWDERCHMMRSLGASGVWELFIPGVPVNHLYKFSIRHRETGQVVLKTDPYGRAFEVRPATAARILSSSDYQWQDSEWLSQRALWDWQREPLSVYEVHLGSWRRQADGHFLTYRALAHELVTYVQPLGFTHVELLPVSEHPLDDSWGYQTTGYYAPTSRFGTPDDFRYFIDTLHQAGIGVLLDWVPAHFPKDEHALARFDGTALYEHEDPRRGEHRDWGTLIYNYGRNEVRNFLLANALYWLKEFHLDGFRVDAVASMLYLNYSREDDDWIPNRDGGNENLEAVDFLRQLNELCHGACPGVVLLAEESTAWPQVTRPAWAGGLGFSMKWNMGWMHDTLAYMRHDPIHRQYHHEQLTFGMMYAFSENFMLPLSHDEVVHGKGSLINKMPGDHWQRFANLRLLYSYQWTYPGTKLLFMGQEFAQWREWAHQEELEWALLDQEAHQGVHQSLCDLNRLYRERSELHQRHFQGEGFEWIDCHDASQSVISYLRASDDGFLIVVLNFTPSPHPHYRLGVPLPGVYREIFNSDSTYYGGSNLGNPLSLTTDDRRWMNRPCSIELTLPPLGALILEREHP